MPGNGTVLDLSGALADHDHPWQTAAPIRCRSRLPGRASRSQAAGEFSAQLPASLYEQGLIDRLVVHVHLRVVGMLQP